MKYFSGKYGGRGTTLYVAAASRAACVRLLNASNHRVTDNDIKNYWGSSWGVTGHEKLGHPTTPGIWWINVDKPVQVAGEPVKLLVAGMPATAVSKLMQEAQDYPLLDRLAVKLYRGGVRSADMIAHGNHPWTVNLTGKLRDIELGLLKIDETLERLAKTL